MWQPGVRTYKSRGDCLLDENHYNQVGDGCHALWGAVLRQAVEDANIELRSYTNLENFIRSEDNKLDAVRWFKNGGFRSWCEMVQMDEVWLKEKIRAQGWEVPDTDETMAEQSGKTLRNDLGEWTMEDEIDQDRWSEKKAYV